MNTLPQHFLMNNFVPSFFQKTFSYQAQENGPLDTFEVVHFHILCQNSEVGTRSFECLEIIHANKRFQGIRSSSQTTRVFQSSMDWVYYLRGSWRGLLSKGMLAYLNILSSTVGAR